MKKKLFFAALALIALASCSSDEYIANNSPDPVVTEKLDAISFGSLSKGITRADHVGADAANLLNKHFTVGGFKVSGTEPNTVFDNYIVQWNENTAGKTESNTSDWEYVGIDVAKPSSLWKDGATVKQTIKFWDYSTDYYDFIAYSTGNANANGNPVSVGLENDEVRVIAIDYANKGTKAYTIGGSRLNLAKCYIADMVTVKKADYQKEVQLTFRSLASKVRMAIYETISGYSVKDVKFYVDDNTSIETGASETEANLFTAGGDTKDYFYTHGTFTIFFPTTGTGNEDNSDYNKAHTSFQPVTGGTTTQRFGDLQYTTAEGQETAGKKYLGRTLNDASYANKKDYEIMLPNEEGTVLELRIDYTLVSTDGSGEEIKIYGAKAFVPAIYTAWKSNYAYTYVFKISDNTNGWTSKLVDVNGKPTDPVGLFPITFDAVVVDAVEHTQSTITSVTTPSITTYQLGHNSETMNEYDASKGYIYITAMADGAYKTDIGTKGYLYDITNTSGNTTAKLEANVMDALNIQVSNASNVITGRNGLVLTRTSLYFATTIPGVDGNDLIEGTDYPQYSTVRFTPETGKTYAFCYEVSDADDKYIYSYDKEATSSTVTNDGTWFEDPNGETAFDGTFSSDKKYYKKYTNLNKVYAVKVIKVQ